MKLDPEIESYYILQGLKAGYFDWWMVRDLLFNLKEVEDMPCHGKKKKKGKR